MSDKKKRGGQQGNKNAAKHGFYAKLLTPEEIARLNGVKEVNPDDEIAILRVIAHRLTAIIPNTITPADADEARKTANTVANITQVINTTQRTIYLGRGNGGEIAKTIMEAIMSLDPYKEL